ncbi:acetyltransferase [Streptomyces longispororuber]|uniref:Acetyltransferase n=1 Tax=Streptomyces longispororuber TaxID=68230 RepID=A0A919DLH1_9ACTN|nr:GNAT family N-acetyltransferase [Streptomyces longispororuber]GHE56558.1 acetyltransferase [Streptomyces longispororuber]
MPVLVAPLMSAGCLAGSAQPSLPVAGGLLLRPWLAKDAAAVVKVFQDPAIQQWHHRRADSEEEAQEWIEKWQRGWQDETGANWAVVDDDSDTVLGRVSLSSVILMGGQAEISYWTAPSARGSGVCSRAVTAVTDWALGEAGFHRLELGHSAANPASCRVAVKAGFTQEGVRRKAMLHADGWHDMHLHARVR